MRFANPQFGWLLFGILLPAALILWDVQRRRSMLRRMAGDTLLPRLTPVLGVHTRILRGILFLLFYLCMVIALMQPRFGSKMQKVEREGVDIIVALDISRSMQAEDMKPNRFRRATHEIAKFIDLLGGDRIGLVVFAGESFVQCPLTLDYSAAHMFLEAVTPEWVQVQGTAIGDAITTAKDAFVDEQKKHKVLVVISDGENHQGEALDAARAAAREGVRIYTVGVGSTKGAPIPLQKRGGNVVYKKDDRGNVVMTRLNPAMLERIAGAGNGKYFHAGVKLHMTHIYDEVMKMEKKRFNESRMQMYKQQYHIFVLCALFFLCMSICIPTITRKGSAHHANV